MLARSRIRVRLWIAGAGALSVPPLLAFAVAVVSGRGSWLPVAVDATLGALALLGACALAARSHRLVLAACLLETLVLGAFVATYRAAPLAAPKPYTGAMPPAAPPLAMRAHRIVTGVIHRTAAFGYRGGAFSERREFVMTAVLLRHPQGDLLVDTGFGRDVAKHLASMPLGFRLATDHELSRPAADQLDAARYDRRQLRGILLTHAHWDHASGLSDFPRAPVLVPGAEARFVAESGWIAEVARTSGARFEEYAFEGGPYLGFPKSHDVYRDGSIVVVPAPGHTPGSVVIFVALPSGRRYALVGDLAWQREGITEREERPWLVRALGDADPVGVRENLLRMAALHAKFPELVLAPAHDPRGFVSLEALPSRIP